ncbi:BlaI/MecI/CopY family transcriptional regulator [Chitinophaga eiseniae]|uniref:BlaI/MecI/CopY family transcriptional regulator n=1 Tax=Chitinophaga eiseniae TaxID=634771 RepID=A0A847SIM2_9BACT|nr:BlaI/MecI/CopY family transcriptional regulator [Chitinophaga eiseniae]NLR78905.1 BlaI/MecI/CopY family transcriptional regulator [Chitinophaga eiseniae]
MKKLSRKEEELMQVIWDLEKAFVKDAIEHLPDPKPHYNTIATLMKRLEEKGYLAHTEYGGSYEYYPIVGKENYKQTFMKKVLNTFFDNSYLNMLAYFAKEEKISPEEMKELVKMIEKDKK